MSTAATEQAKTALRARLNSPEFIAKLDAMTGPESDDMPGVRGEAAYERRLDKEHTDKWER